MFKNQIIKDIYLFQSGLWIEALGMICAYIACPQCLWDCLDLNPSGVLS